MPMPYIHDLDPQLAERWLNECFPGMKDSYVPRGHSLVEEDYDPTYGNSHTIFNVFECACCSALVNNWENHVRWHAETFTDS